MGIEWAESFTGWNAATMAGLYNNPSNPSTPQAGGPNGQKYYPLNGNGTTLPKQLSADLARVLTGFRWLYNGGAGTFLRILDTAAIQLQLSVDVAGRVTVTGGAQLFVSAPNLIRQGTWNYIELDTTINNATGAVLLKVNGVTVANLANVNTRGGSASNTCNTVMVVGVSGADGMADWYILNATGAPNALLGDVVVVPLRPAAAGFYQEWALGAGASKTVAVQDATPDGDASYNLSGTVGQRDTYTNGHLPATLAGTIAGVVVKTNNRKDDAGARVIAGMCRSAGVDAAAAGQPVIATYAWLADAFATDPGGAAWTVASVNGAEFGYKLIS